MNRLQLIILSSIKANKSSSFAEIFIDTKRRMNADLDETYIKNFVKNLERKRYIVASEEVAGFLGKTTVTKYEIERRGNLKLRGININAVHRTEN